MFVGSTLEAFQVVIAKQVVFYDNSIANGWNYIPNTVQVPAMVINIHVVTMKMSVYFLISWVKKDTWILRGKATSETILIIMFV